MAANTSGMSSLILLLAFVPCLVSAICECGYVAQGSSDGEGSWLFTQLIESNFNKITNISLDSDWVREQFNVTASAGRGQYGKAFMTGNVEIFNTSQALAAGQTAGLDLRVGSQLIDGAVPTAELDTAREDLLYGSYRAGMKLTPVNGTCASLFWYFNNTEEIDMEFLSREFDQETGTYPVNLVVQSLASMEAGYNAANTSTYKVVNLTFDPTTDFHEYRFDFLPGRVLFYADSELLTEMEGSAIPTSPGHLILQHWSNGNPLWSGGPPAQDAYLTVSYVKAYFNSSDADKQSEWAKTCAAATSNQTVCLIPNVTAANASTGGSFFTNGTTDTTTSGAVRLDHTWVTMMSAVLTVLVMSWL